jgi:hypothetical protein
MNMNKKSKILLVNPEVPNTFWSLKSALEFVSKNAILPPLGLLTVAAMLPESFLIKRFVWAVTAERENNCLHRSG